MLSGRSLIYLYGYRIYISFGFIRSDDPRAYANSPNALTQHNLGSIICNFNFAFHLHSSAQYNDSPQDFYGLSAKKEPITFNRINSAEDYSLESERRRKSSSTHNTSGKSLTGDEYENANNKVGSPFAWDMWYFPNIKKFSGHF
jgi:hypothetical protein